MDLVRDHLAESFKDAERKRLPRFLGSLFAILSISIHKKFGKSRAICDWQRAVASLRLDPMWLDTVFMAKLT